MEFNRSGRSASTAFSAVRSSYRRYALQFNCNRSRERKNLNGSPAGLIVGKELRVNRIVLLEIVLHVGEEDRNIYELIPGRARVLQDGAHVVEDRATLFFDVVGNDIPVFVQFDPRNLLGSSFARSYPGKEEQVSDTSSVRVEAYGFWCL
jgi:hypothetical protein